MTKITIHLGKDQEKYVRKLMNVSGLSRYETVKNLFIVGTLTTFIVDTKIVDTKSLPKGKERKCTQTLIKK